MHRTELETYLNTLLSVDTITDYGPNGLQVEGKPEIERLVTGVSANLDLIEAAIEHEADALLVHHGLIWWDFDRHTITGRHKQRLKRLFDHEINLYGYHLPLDIHPTLGNSAQIGKMLGLQNQEPHFDYKDHPVGVTGNLPEQQPKEELFPTIKKLINPDSLILPYGPDTIQKIGIVSGSGDSEFETAIDLGCDLFITGEIKEHITHIAREEHIHYIAAGHHATERFGVQALGRHLRDEQGLCVEYIDIENPV